MNNWATLIGSMSAEQGRRLLAIGTEKNLEAGLVLLEEARPVQAMYFIVDGLFHVRTAQLGEEPVAVLGSGEVIGEMSFLDPHEASASVVAAEDSRVLVLPHHKIRDFLDTEPRLATEFYRRLGILEVRRLRRTMGHLERRIRDAAESEAGPVGQARTMLDAFKDLLLDYDKALTNRDESTRGALEARLPSEFARLTAALNDLAGQASPLSELQRQTIAHLAQRELMPFLQQTEVARRMYTKPRGYAGDFYTIQLIYENKPGGTGVLGRFLDNCFLQEPAAQAVCNRRGLLAEQIQHEIRSSQASTPPRSARITSLACGPAREIFDVLEQSSLADRLDATLVDMDAKALAFVRERLESRPHGARVDLVQENLIYLAVGRSKLEIPPQDLIYSIGLIDYFGDDLVIKLLDWTWSLLRPGGRAIFGNFHPSNPTRALMDYVLEWRLYHRDEDDMNRLFQASRFGRPCTRILFEDQRINLFAECVRGPS